MSLLKNFVNPWELDKGVLETNVLDTDILTSRIFTDKTPQEKNIVAIHETTEYAISNFRPLAVSKELKNYTKTLAIKIGGFHRNLLNNKVYNGVFQQLNASQLWYRPEVWYSKKNIGGIFLDERSKRTGSQAHPYGIALYTRNPSTIPSQDVLFEEVMHAIVHRHYKVVKPEKVNLLYEELGVRLIAAYAGIVHPKEDTATYMKGFRTNQAVKDYFKALEEGKGFDNIDIGLRTNYIKAFEQLRDIVYQHYIKGGYGSKKNNPISSVPANRHEILIKYIIRISNV